MSARFIQCEDGGFITLDTRYEHPVIEVPDGSFREPGDDFATFSNLDEAKQFYLEQAQRWWGHRKELADEKEAAAS
jgi:hypothetical protein